MMIDLHGHPAYAYTGGRPFDAALPTAVFVHGAQYDHSVWALQSRYFAHHGFGVLAVDLPAHNRSGGAPLPTVDALADWLIALLDAARVTRALLIGHSMGALIALAAAARQPTRTVGLALLGAGFPMAVSDALRNAARDSVPDAIALANQWSHALLAPRASVGTWPAGVAARLMERVARHDSAPVFATDLEACHGYRDGLTAAAALRCPTLFVCGRRDRMMPPHTTRALADAVAGAPVDMVQLDAGHALMTEAPDAVLEALYAFARRCCAAAAVRPTGLPA